MMVNVLHESELNQENDSKFYQKHNMQLLSHLSAYLNSVCTSQQSLTYLNTTWSKADLAQQT
jgi:hypothetical protein